MDYQYRYWYENSWSYGALQPRFRSICEERCHEELRRLEQSFYREMDNLRRYSYSGDDYYRRAEYDITSYYYTQRDRINEYWKRQEYYEQRGYYGYGYRDHREIFYNPPIYYNLTYTLSNPNQLQLENKNMPTEKKKYIITNGLDAEDTEFSIHDTLAEAEKEAQQKARDNEGEEFIIFESKKSYKIAGPPLEEKVFV